MLEEVGYTHYYSQDSHLVITHDSGNSDHQSLPESYLVPYMENAARQHTLLERLIPVFCRGLLVLIERSITVGLLVVVIAPIPTLIRGVIVSCVGQASLTLPDRMITQFAHRVTVATYMKRIYVAIRMAFPMGATSPGVERPTCDFLETLVSPCRDLIRVMVNWN